VVFLFSLAVFLSIGSLVNDEKPLWEFLKALRRS
jgi:hypothetical protein